MSSLNTAIKFAKKGWKVFPLISRTKKPATPNGLKDATGDERQIAQDWGNKTHLNLAIRTGECSGFFVVDLDGEEGINNFNALVKTMGGLPDTLTVKTGKGYHLYFTYPEGLDIRNSTSKICNKVDVRGNGGYVVAPPSVHPDGSIYKFEDESLPVADAPQWLIDSVMRKIEKEVASIQPDNYYTSSSVNESWTLDDVEQMLEALSPDMPYDDWLSVGMSLHQGGYPLATWDSWSHQSEKYEPNCCAVRWRGFGQNTGITMGTLVQMAQVHGWKPEVKTHDLDPTNIHGVNIAPFLDKIKNSAKSMTGTKKKTTSDPDQISQILFQEYLPDLITDTVSWINETAIKPQPELALLNVLTALGAIYGRFYSSPFNTRTNIYMVGIAGTGAGKDHSRKQVKGLMLKSELQHLIGGDMLVSAPGVLIALKNAPSHILHLDEFGMLLKGMGDDRAPPYLKMISKTLTELFSSSGSTYLGGTYADEQKKPVIINAPNLCIFGTSTPEKYIEGLSRSSITSGELNRYIVIPSLQSGKRRRRIGDVNPPEDLVESWKFIADSPIEGLGSVPSASVLPDPVIVGWGLTEERIYNMGLFEDEMMETYAKEGTAPLWGRYRENAIKIAMILAITRMKDSPIINDCDLDFAESLVKSSVQYQRTLALEHMTDNEYERNRHQILQTMQLHGGIIARTELFRSVRNLPKRDLDTILATLLEGHIIETVLEQTGGRPSTSYKIV